METCAPAKLVSSQRTVELEIWARYCGLQVTVKQVDLYLGSSRRDVGVLSGILKTHPIPWLVIFVTRTEYVVVSP